MLRVGGADPGVLRSRYIETTSVVPAIEECPDSAFVEALERVARQAGDRPVLFPISDVLVLRVARNAPAIRGSFRLLASSADSTETLVNKRCFYESLEQRGIPHPATRFPGSRAEFEKAAGEIGWPVLIKPEISPLFARKFGRKGFVAHEAEELFRHFATLESSGLRVMLQEIVPGDARCMHGCAGLRTAGATLHVCYRRVREFPPGFGCGSLLESVPSFVGETRLLEYLEGIGYEGIFDAEFKLDPRDGVYKLIEINARSWWQNLLPTVSGLNVIKAAYDHAVGRAVAPAPYRSGAKWIHLYNDFFAARDAKLGIAGWLRSLEGERAFDVWAADDVRPMLSMLAGLARGKLVSLLGLRRG